VGAGQRLAFRARLKGARLGAMRCWQNVNVDGARWLAIGVSSTLVSTQDGLANSSCPRATRRVNLPLLPTTARHPIHVLPNNASLPIARPSKTCANANLLSRRHLGPASTTPSMREIRAVRRLGSILTPPSSSDADMHPAATIHATLRGRPLQAPPRLHAIEEVWHSAFNGSPFQRHCSPFLERRRHPVLPFNRCGYNTSFSSDVSSNTAICSDPHHQPLLFHGCKPAHKKYALERRSENQTGSRSHRKRRASGTVPVTRNARRHLFSSDRSRRYRAVQSHKMFSSCEFFRCSVGSSTDNKSFERTV